MSITETVLSVKNLTTEFRLRDGWFPAVRNISFDLKKNETLCLVGESGCGKSMTSLSIMGLVNQSTGKAKVSGEINYDGQNLLDLGANELNKLRGSRIAMIFQEPMTSLNPVLTVGQQIMEPLIHHRGMTVAEAEKEAIKLLSLVKIPDAKTRLGQYPHHFSGGMRQRVMISMALACKPDVLIADEPTTALDVTIQAQVLSLLGELQEEYGLSLILITHDLGVVASVADRVAVMYAGEIVEMTDVNTLFNKPRHPYTEALMQSMPRADRNIDNLVSIEGQVPSINKMPAGCRFMSRCSMSEKKCETHAPVLEMSTHADSEQAVRCWVRGS